MKDIFKRIVKENKLNKQFTSLCTSLELEPAKVLIEKIIQKMPDKDGNFIQQFQTTGFDSRLWEIFLFAFFKENELTIIDKYDRPDFYLEKEGFDFFVEATLSNEVENDKFTKSYILDAIDNKDFKVQQEITDHYVIRMGSILRSKLKKEYWKHEWVKDKPLIIAISAGHNFLARFLPDSKVTEYLYGKEYVGEINSNGLFVKEINSIQLHKFQNKEIPSNFFAQPGTENISAVLFTNNCDVNKFNRMGYQSGLIDKKIIMVRAGFSFDKSEQAKSKKFSYSISPGEFKEDWKESVSIFHNPNALHPLDRLLFPGVRQIWAEPNGELVGMLPEFFAFVSETKAVIF